MKISPSVIGNKEVCCCFDYLPSEDNGAADEGTLLHKAVEEEDTRQCETDEQRDTVEHALIYAQSVLSGHQASDLRTVMKEKKLRIPVLECNGVIDWLATFRDGLAECIDWKFGRRGSVNAEDNLQAMCYVLAIFEAFPEITSVRAHIVMARSMEPTVPCTFGRDRIPDITVRLKSALAKAEDPFKRPSAIDLDLCVRCAHTTRCPAYNKTVQVVAEYVVEKSNLPAVFQASALTSPEDMARAKMLSTAMKEWAEGIDKVTTDYVRNGGTLPGYRFVNKAGNRSIINSMDAIERLRSTGTLADFDILPVCKLPFGALANVLAAVRKVSKEEAKKQLEAVLGTLVVEGHPVQYLQRSKAAKEAKDA